ncbi:MAG: TIGR04086 family membrane protein [Clostridia bacterium]|nr:TIGR04086 family membrane protein [Clostridia bacterium]
MAKIKKGDVFDVLRSALLSVLISIVLVIIFAVIVKFADIGEKVIIPVNIAIKILSIALGMCIGVRHGNMGIVKGLLTGLIFAALTYLISGIAGRDFSVSSMTLYDALACGLAGIISGIIAVNIRSRSKA